VTCVAGCDRQARFVDSSDYGPEVAIIAPSELIESASHLGDNMLNKGSGTSYASPIVAGIMSVFVGFEHLNNNVGTVRDRLMRNSLSDYVTNVPAGTINKFAQSGIHNPTKGGEVPYNGAPPQPLANGQDTAPVADEPPAHITTTRQYRLLKSPYKT